MNGLIIFNFETETESFKNKILQYLIYEIFKKRLYNVKFMKKLKIEIPIEIANLINLTHIHCSDNKIKEIPIEIMNCRNLIDCFVHNNEIDYIQPQIERWLNELENNQQIYVDEHIE